MSEFIEGSTSITVEGVSSPDLDEPVHLSALDPVGPDPIEENRKDIADVVKSRADKPNPAQTKVWTDLYLSRYGRLPDDHPLQRYVSNQFTRICDDSTIRVYVAEGNMEMNAFATADRVIVLSKKIIELCKTEEELLFLLHHEYVHIQNGHFEHHPPPNQSYVDRLLTDLGKGRKQEIAEADMESLFRLDKKGINIAGAFRFLERMQEWEESRPTFLAKKGPHYDVEHGTLRQRIVLLKGTLNFKDFVHYRPDTFTPRPDHLEDPELYKDTYGFPVETEFQDIKERLAIREERIKTMTARELYVNILDLLDEFLRIRARYPKGEKKYNKSPHARMYLDQVPALYRKMKEAFLRRAQEEWGIREEIPRQLLALLKKLMTAEDGGEWATPQVIDTLKRIAEECRDSAIRHQISYEPRSGRIFYRVEEALGAIRERVDDNDAYEAIRSTLLLVAGGVINADPTPPPTDSPEDCSEVPGSETLTSAQIDLLYALSLLVGKEGFDKGIIWAMMKLEIPIAQRPGPSASRALQKINRLKRVYHTPLQLLEWWIGKGKESGFDLHLRLMEMANVWINEEEIEQPRRLCRARRIKIPEDLAKLDEVMARADHYCIRELDRHEGMERENLEAAQTGSLDTLMMIIGECFSALPVRDGFDALEAWIEERRKQYPWMDTRSIWSSWISKGSWKNKLSLDNYEYLMREPEVASSLHDMLFDQAAHTHIVKTRADIDRFLDLLKRTAAGRLFDLEALHSLILDYDHAFYRILGSQKDWDFEDPNDRIRLLRIADMPGDPIHKGILAHKVWKAILDEWRRHSPPEIATFLKQTVTEMAVPIPQEILKEIIETFAETREDMDACKEIAREQLTDERRLGAAVVAENVAPYLGGDLVEALCALLEPDSDQRLKDILLKRYFFFGQETKYTSVLTRGPEEIRKGLYNMNEAQKAALLQVLLIGEKGILFDLTSVEQLIEFLFDHYVDTREGDETDRRFVAEARKILKLALKESNPEDTHFIFTKLLQPRVLRNPAKPCRWEDTPSYKEIFESQIPSYDKKRDIYYDGSRTERWIEDQIETGGGTEDEKRSRKLKRRKLIRKVDYLFDADKTATPPKKFDAIGLLIEIASAMGSIGTRFLQLMGLYMDVPERYREAVNQVYSDMEGQIKLTAYDTLVRHLPTEDQADLRIGERIGGGAMLTTYPFESRTKKGIVKIVNPNLISRTESTFGILERTFTTLVEEDPARYTPLLMLLDDIKAWVLADIDLAAHADLDRDFHENNDAVRDSATGLTSCVPKVLMAHSKFLIEERAPGTTLHNAEMNATTVNNVIDLIRRRFYDQVLRGIVHSDLHPGNLTLDDEGNLSWLDRTLILKLTPVEQDILLRAAMEPDETKRLVCVAEGILNLPENQSVPIGMRTEILNEICAIPADEAAEQRLRRAMIRLRTPQASHRVRVPLNLTLLLKNQMALDKMEQQFTKRAHVRPT